jgi:hypothetical protein
MVLTPRPDPAKVQRIVYTLRKELGMSLLGIDIVIENGSGRYGIIDINEYPGDVPSNLISSSFHSSFSSTDIYLPCAVEYQYATLCVMRTEVCHGFALFLYVKCWDGTFRQPSLLPFTSFPVHYS